MIKFQGFDLVTPINRIKAGVCAIASNVRAYISGGFMLRNPLTAPIQVPEGTSESYTSATISQSGSGAAWSNPSNLESVSSQTTISLSGSSSASSSTATGTSTGGGVAWSDPGNIDASGSSYATVNISSGGGVNYTPSQVSGGASAYSSSGTQTNTKTLSGFPSVSESSCTLYIQVSGSVSVQGFGNGFLTLQYSINSGSSWTTYREWTTSFSSQLLSIPLSGISNLNTIQLQIIAMAVAKPEEGGTLVSCQISVANWYATAAGSGQPNSQTLQGAVSGLSVPSGATITGVEIAINAEYSGTSPQFTVSLNVGNQTQTITLTSTPAVHTVGGNGVLWGYSSWTNTTLASLVANFLASTTGASVVSANAIVFMVYYVESSELLEATAIAFPAIPTSATITGIQLSFQGTSSIPGTTGITVQPLNSGTSVGNPVTQTLQSGPQSYLIGGITYLWNYSWTPAIINGLQLGFSFQASTSGTSVVTSGLNNLNVTVYYTADVPLELPNPPLTIGRLNDSTPAGPPSGFGIIIAAGTSIYDGTNPIASGMSGNPVSMIPFRPNASVQPWMYIGDNSQTVALSTTSLFSGQPTTFPCFGMIKVRSDGTVYKTGIEEPQSAPVVGTQPTAVSVVGTLYATAIPWTNYDGANPDYNYGESNGYPNPTDPDGTAPFVINCENATSITLNITGTATINGNSSATPTTTGPSTGVSTNPGHYVQEESTGTTPPATATVVIGSFTDGEGNVVPVGQPPLYVSSVVDVGGSLGTAIPVPYGAVAFQVGINSTGNTFSSNSGSFSLSATVTTTALPTVLSTLGSMTAWYWPDSPTTGPVGVYIWKNPSDGGGSGPTRTTSTASGSTSGNSFIFDANFGTDAVPAQPAGIPGPPGVDMYSTAPSDVTVPMAWTQLNPQSVAVSTESLYQPALKGVDGNTAYQNFNFCMTGILYIPQPGQYEFILTYKDDIIWGIGGGATLVSSSGQQLAYSSGNPPGDPTVTDEATSLSNAGQTITVVNGLPLLPRVVATYSNHGQGGVESQATVVVSFPTAGEYPIEVDYDFWYHSGRILVINASATPDGTPTIIPPLPANVRENTQYRYCYRSSATGATSNPSPESPAISLPVTASTITSYWSPDPQVDVVDYYRIDSVTSSFTYVCTGPNDNSRNGTNTPVTDSLTDTELGTQLLSYDNYEPFPSIDLPQKGVLNASGGVLTWVSGGAIGGSSSGFNQRWLAGTSILIGSPTSLAYVLIARPTSSTQMTIPGVPDGTNLAYEIPEPILAAQPLPYLFGPTDNINFAFGLGDPLRPGTLYWCAGSNFDSAPDTNQLDVTDPSEPLVNGALSGGRGVLFSIIRAWVIMPNFFNALATVTGTQGSTFTLQETSINRGLFIARCLAVSGGGNIFFRVDDGVHFSPNGLGSKSITDENLYPLFSHEGSTPQSVTRNGITVYPPDDSNPEAQQFSFNNGYLYYDYEDSGGNPHTLVFDEAAMGWVWDVYEWPATVHAANEDISQQGFLVGCIDGSVRQLQSGGSESLIGTVLSPAFGGIGWQHAGKFQLEYSASTTVTLTLVPADADNGSYGPPSITLPSTGGNPTKYFVRMGPNKYKWAQLLFQTLDPEMQVYIDGICVWTKSWGSTGPYTLTQPFASEGGAG